MRRLFSVETLLPLAARAAALAVTALAVAAPALAAPPPSQPPSISIDVAGVKQADGNYLWKYDLFTGVRPSLSHWVLGTCNNVFNSVIGSTVVGGPIEFDTPDPSSGANGIKFNAAVGENKTVIYSFETSQDWAPTLLTATFKAGTNITSQSVLGPGCSLRPHDPPISSTPEPCTLALLGGGMLPLFAALRRRKA